MSPEAIAHPAYSPGLEGVVAGETTLSNVNPERNSLVYRGYDIQELVEHAAYEEVAYLLIYGHLPTANELKTFNQTLLAERTVPSLVLEAYKQLPKTANLMDMLRLGNDILTFHDPDAGDDSHAANIRKATRLVAKFPLLVAHGYRLRQGQSVIEPDSNLGLAENFLYMLTGQKPSALAAKTFNTTLILYADHGFNASTFAARVTTSTLSDLHSGVSSAIGALKGSLHGGANEEAMKMLLEIGSPENAEIWIKHALATKRKIMGFGHREYKTGDPRAMLLSKQGESLCNELGQPQWFQIANTVERVMREEKAILPNVDFPTAYIYYILGLPIEIYTPIFAIARVAGWTAHIIEQLDNNRLIRPKAIYTGPAYLQYVSVHER